MINQTQTKWKKYRWYANCQFRNRAASTKTPEIVNKNKEIKNNQSV